MSRISTRAANTLLLNQSIRTQQRLFDAQVSVASEKKTQVYQGIAIDSRRLVNIENSRDLLGRFNANNDQMDVKLEVMNTSTEAIRTTISDFRTGLGNYETTSKTNAIDVKDIQDHAFRALKAIEGYLNIDIDGQYLFAGSRVLTEPVDFGLSTLAAYQAKYNGDTVAAPTTRDGSLENFSFGQDELNKSSMNINSANFLQFRQDSADELTRLISSKTVPVETGTVTTVSSAAVGGVVAGTSLIHSNPGGGAITNTATDTLGSVFGMGAGTMTVSVAGTTVILNDTDTLDIAEDTLESLGNVSVTYNLAQNEINITAAGGTDMVFTNGTSATGIADIGLKDSLATAVASTVTQTFAALGNNTDTLQQAYGVSATDILTFDSVGGDGTNDAVAFTVDNKTSDDLIAWVNSLDSSISASFNTASSQIDITSVSGGSQLTFSDGGTGLTNLAFTDGTTTTSNGASSTFTYKTNQTDTDSLTAAYGASATDVFTITLGTGRSTTFTVGNQTVADLNTAISALDTSITATYDAVSNKINITSPTAGTEITFKDTFGSAIDALSLNDGSPLASGEIATFTIDGLQKSSTITATSGIFANASVGSVIDITDSASNNGTYTVSAISSDKKTLTINSKMLTDENEVAATVSYTDPDDRDQTLNLSVTDFATLNFNRSTNTISSATTNGLSALKVGAAFSVSGTANNNGTYTVVSNDGTSLVVESQKLTDEGLTSGDTFLDYFSNADVTFDAATKTIDARRPGLSELIPNTFNGLEIGQSITVTNSAANPGPFVVASIAADGSSITVAETLVTETDTDGLVLGSTSNSNFSFTSDTQLVFDATNETIQLTDNAAAAIPNAFSNLSAGMRITATNMPTDANNRIYTVVSVSSDGSTITVEEDITASETDIDGARLQVFAASGKIEATSYYTGDERTNVHRVGTTQKVTQDIDAIDPAFEKAIRALQLIAQGEFGTVGGLDQNNNRVDEALYLINSSLQRAVSGTPPFGDELAGNIEQVEIDIGYQRVLMQTTTEINLQLMAFYDESAANIENADIQEVITRLLDDQNALEASYQAYARISQLSLTNFL